MFDDLPEDIERALRILYNFADDACISGRTRDEADKEGYEIDGQSCHFITFAISRNRSWEDVIA